MKVIVLASGKGSNLKALAHYAERKEALANFSIRAVLSDKESCQALAWANSKGWYTKAVPPKMFASRTEWDEAVANELSALKPDLVVLAGFMRIIGKSVIESARHSIINVHPALLPSFPGGHAVEDALTAGVRVSGCTVHQVDEGVDTGHIIAQSAVEVFPHDDVVTLHARIQKAEHILLPQTVEKIAQGRIVLSSNTPPARPLFLERTDANHETEREDSVTQ